MRTRAAGRPLTAVALPALQSVLATRTTCSLEPSLNGDGDMQKLRKLPTGQLLQGPTIRTSSGYLLLVVQFISQGQSLDQLLAVAPDGRLHLLQGLGQLGHGQLAQPWWQTGTSWNAMRDYVEKLEFACEELGGSVSQRADPGSIVSESLELLMM